MPTNIVKSQKNYKQMTVCNVQSEWVLTFATNGQLLINNVKLAFNLLQCCSSQMVFLQHIVKQLLSTAQTADTQYITNYIGPHCHTGEHH